MVRSRFKAWHLAVVVALVSTVFFAATLLNTLTVPKSFYRIRSEVTYVNEGVHPWNLSKEDLTFYLFMNTTLQEVRLVDASHPISYKSVDEDGNSYLILEADKLKIYPNENFTCLLEFNAVRPKKSVVTLDGEPGSLKDIPSSLKESFCVGNAVWQIDDCDLRRLAETEAKSDIVLDIVLNYVKWIKSNIRYSFGQETPMYPNETYRLRRGDCDDQAILLITLCRIYGIPAYLQLGCIYDPTQPYRELNLWGGHFIYEAERISWHGWAMVYIPPWGWLPVDLTFMEDEPITAITDAAVNSESLIVYMNVSNQDYVRENRMLKSYLEKNNFKIVMHDSMELIETSGFPFTTDLNLQIQGKLITSTSSRRLYAPQILINPINTEI